MAALAAAHPDAGRFNEAEAFTPRILAGNFGEAVEEQASMRPRLLHLGYLFVCATRSHDDQASMRPRLLHLGYAAREAGEE